MTMKKTADILNGLRTFKRTCSQRYGIDTLMLFGSVARGEQREGSDVNVCIKASRPIDYFALQDARDELQSLLGVKVDLLTLHDRMQPLFRKNIERDAIYV